MSVSVVCHEVMQAKIADLRAENEALKARVAALIPYVEHRETCDSLCCFGSKEKLCTCGLAAALTAAKEGEK